MKIDRVGGDLRPEKIIKKRIEGGRGTGDEIRLHGEAGASVEQKNGRHQWKKDELPGKCVNEECKQTPRKRGRGENSCVGKLTYSMWENVQLFKSSALFLRIKGVLSRFIPGCIYMEKR